MPRLLFAFFVFFAAKYSALTAAEITRVLPPPGIKLSDADRAELEKQTAEFERQLLIVTVQIRAKSTAADLLPDVAVYAKAVRFALTNGEFYDPKDVAKAKAVLKSANERLQELKANKAAWPSTPGPQVRAYRSHTDDSLQPYGLELPEKFDPSKTYRLVVWLRGRSDKGTDMHFIAEREKKRGEFQFANAIILHPFGRHCNAYKFAGETDVIEAILDVQKRYRVDEKPILMGFSMGGAGCWHLAARSSFYWAAASPGAGFVDVRRYQNLSGEKLPPWYEQVLWNEYDVPPYTNNLFQIPLLSYSGELDKQKASADIMAEEFERRGKKLFRVIGKGMGHKYDKPSIEKITKWVESNFQGDPDYKPLPAGSFAWSGPEITSGVMLDGREFAFGAWPHAQEEQYAPTSVTGKLVRKGNALELIADTKNLRALKVSPFHEDVASKKKIAKPEQVTLQIDGQKIKLDPKTFDDTLQVWKKNGTWAIEDPRELRKSEGLAGPIDDVWSGKIMFVRPTGKSKYPQTAAWVEQEMQHQLDRWRLLFRGEIPVKKDIDVTEEELSKYNLILWGDADSNSIIKKYADYLPLKWQKDNLVLGNQIYPAENHVIPMIYPRPDAIANGELVGSRYLVLNSGPTFREGHDKTNSQQTPKLPDWAVIDITTPPSDTAPGKIVNAGFFDKDWKFVDPAAQKKALGYK